MGWERGELASEPPDEQPFPLLRSIVYAAHCTFSLIQIFKIVKINFVKYKNSQKLLRDEPIMEKEFEHMLVLKLRLKFASCVVVWGRDCVKETVTPLVDP